MNVRVLRAHLYVSKDLFDHASEFAGFISCLLCAI